MNQIQTEQLASQHIDQLQQAAARARLARAFDANRTPPRLEAAALSFARASAGIRHWFARAQLGPANNYVTR